MPEAVVSNSTPMPEGQPPLRVDMDDFSHLVDKIEALAYLVGSSMDNGRPHEDIRNGIAYLMQDQASDLRSFFEEFQSERDALFDLWRTSSEDTAYARTMKRLRPGRSLRGSASDGEAGQ